MDTAQWPQQEILMKPMEEIIPKTCSSSLTTPPNIIPSSDNDNSKPSSNSLERNNKVRPQKDQSLNCPRCNSTNTKFCYYNNYSLTQPRYFCKSCKRYWTQGGSLRNIPVGGGSRKNKRSSSSSLSPSTDALSIKNPKIIHQGQDLNLGFNPNHQEEFRNLTEFMQLPTIENTQKGQFQISGANHHHNLSGLELLNGLTSSTRGLTPFMPMRVPEHGNGVYSSGLLFPPLEDYKPSLSFSLVDGLADGNGYGGLEGNDNVEHQASVADERNNGRLLFPFEDLKQVSNSTSADHHNSSADNDNHNNNHEKNGDQGDSTTGFWSGMLGSGGSW